MSLFSRAGRLSASTAFPGIGLGTRPVVAVKPTPAPADPVPAPAAHTPAGEATAKAKGKDKDGKDAPASDDDDDKNEDADDDEDDADGDDASDDKDMRRGAKSALRRGRMRANARIAAIMAHPSAAKDPAYALDIALTTQLPRSQAIGLVERHASKMGRGNTGLDSRMNTLMGGLPEPGPAPDAQQQAAAGWGDAFGKHAVTAPKKS